MKYISISDTTRIIMVPGTKAQLTLRLPVQSKKNPYGNPSERFDKHTDDVLTKLAKCTGKHKKHVLKGGDARNYPGHGECMTTASYVKRYMTLNANLLTDNFGTLSTNVQTWPGEPIEEINHD